ncbi:MAG: DUF2085 domain-containing protein [Chloroflexota bacterium]|nr:DUF2085 domain-containing protein [Chloroflexota bacterium]
MQVAKLRGVSPWSPTFNLWTTLTVVFLAVVAPSVLFLLPGTLEHKSYLVLHGLCAQRPSHSFLLGGQTLPFDARMTGIYGGFPIAAVYLLRQGRFRAFATPSPGTLLLLGGFVALLAVDGINSLLLDMRLWHPYAPLNELRLATGLLTAVSLAVVLAYLVSITLWRTGLADRAVVRDVRELSLLAAAQAPFGLAIFFGPGWLFPVVTIWLMSAALLVCALLALVVIVLVRRQDGLFSSWREASDNVALASVLALVIVGGLAAGRVWLEHLTGVVVH